MDEQYQKLYRITLKDYNKLLINQNNKCFICGGVDDKKTLSVDHDHRTGKVRGLLCIRCNRLLGYARDNPTILHSAELYLLSRI